MKPAKGGKHMTNQSIGEKITKLRKERGMTQKELAEEMSVTDKAVSKWEREISCPDINSIPRLAEILGVSVEELLNATQKEPQESDQKIQNIIDFILKAIPLAMGVSLVVTSLLREIDLYSGFSMTGIALFCIALLLLKSTKVR